MGKQAIEIKKIEDKDKRVVTFSKRRKGLFKKAATLSSECGAQVAVIVFSDTGKLYSSGHPSDVDPLIHRYTNYQNSNKTSSSSCSLNASSTAAAAADDSYHHRDREEGSCRMRNTEVEEESILNAASEIMINIDGRRHHHHKRRSSTACGKGNKQMVMVEDEDEESLEELEREEMELKFLHDKVTSLLNELSPPTSPPLPLYSLLHNNNNQRQYPYHHSEDIDLELHL